MKASGKRAGGRVAAAGAAERMLRIAHLLPSARTLGPGRRAVIWVQGCARGCPGCVAAPLRDPAGGVAVPVRELVERALAWPGIAAGDGLTISGGEPFEQAAALADLCAALRARRDLSILAFSGFTLAELEGAGDPDRKRLLGMLDVLVDGPFVEALAADLLWRGSANQRVRFLTERHADLAPSIQGPGVGIEIRVTPDGRVFWAGVPPPGLTARLPALLAAHGLSLAEMEGSWA
jgi:anaerobic ribonucleoside-triphosphate reductase activating protein